MNKEIHTENAEKISRGEKFQENDTEREHENDNDFFEVAQSFGSEEEEPCEEKESEEVEDKLCKL